MLLLGIFLVTIALGLLAFVVLRRRTIGLPRGELISADSDEWEHCEREFFSPRYRLVGRPDYLFKEKGRFVPVEIKSGRSPISPYASHVFQLIAYCLLVEENTGSAPPYGIIAYRNGHFKVEYTPALKAELVKILEEMRQTLALGLEPEVRESTKCLKCGYRHICFG